MALTDSLISYWKLDESSGNATDSHGSNTLTDVNTVTSTTGKIGTARLFTAANSERLSLTDNADVSISTDQDFTISAWVKLTSFTGSSQGIVTKDDVGLNREYNLFVSSGSGTFRFSIFVSGTEYNLDSDVAAPSTGTWYFLVAWHDSAANTLNLQTNNAAEQSISHTLGTCGDLSAGFSLGGFSNDTRFLDGAIDEVGFWKRVLTSGERTSLYNSGAGLAYPFSAFTPPQLKRQFQAVNRASTW